ncbi:PEP phosphonomutase-like protein [Aspergillus campestris IBT 28561]|uniref:PEP phosphonomutase-like protein n=1 Tax=Aspergillus campestris (strain IBT 28561) TaxID=1392248 RepID=A0A2I1DH51_ASPC2|nr:PEP phosphonomutase-like protein [Aspergillus campestris IBT 28561]PKY09201.1 PEP phosphonomutase-like protein [Aspergillus campestris IBT 28561]
MSSDLNILAKSFKSLHKPHQPVILANVYDGISAKAVGSLPATKVIATASYAIAEAAGTVDKELTREQNMRGVEAIALATKELGKPLTVDIQDGYGEQLGGVIKQVISAGAVGVNLEDYDIENKRFYSATDAANRIKLVLSTASALGVPDFVVNARVDPLLYGGTIEEVISRGRVYLAAGATSIFVLGPLEGPHPGALTKEQITELVEAFAGRLNVSLFGRFTTKEVASLGVSRISIGPKLQFVASAAFQEEAKRLFNLD